MQIRVIAIEDEPLALKKLISFIEKINYLKVTATFDNAIDAISYLKSNEVDLIFLDIQMEEFTGIQFLEAVHNRPKVIITSAYSEYAIKGYEFDVADYLLKPFTFERFIKAVDKIAEDFKEVDQPTMSDTIFIKTEYRLEKVKIADILYIEGMSEYLRVHTKDKKLMTRQNFKSMAGILPHDHFVRVHKSYMVAIDQIEVIERNRITIGETKIPIGESYKEAFYKVIGM